MVDTYDFSNQYGADPWANITLNERTWYNPNLQMSYYRQSVYSQYANFQINLAAMKSRTIVFNEMIATRPNIAPIDNRTMNATRMYTDSAHKQVTVVRYGNGMSVHKESEMFNYWEQNGREAALIRIINESLGQVLVDHLDQLARNAYFNHPYPQFGNGSASGFSEISATDDRLTTTALDNIWLSIADTDMPFAPLPTQAVVTGDELVCVTTPGTIYDLKREVGTSGTGDLTFVDVMKYADGVRLISGEEGKYRNIRFVKNNLAKLFNCGTIDRQTTIKSPVTPGSGAPDPATTKVDGIRQVGQPGATHYIIIDNAVGLSVNDKVTVHQLRHDDETSVAAYNHMGVVHGVKFDDPMKQDLVIQSIDTSGGFGAHKLVFKEPYMMVSDAGKGLETDLGGGVYGFVTKAQHIHTALFLIPNAQAAPIVAGVAQPPMIYTPPSVDDFESIKRVTYDMWLKFGLWEPNSFRLWTGAGANFRMGQSAVSH